MERVSVYANVSPLSIVSIRSLEGQQHSARSCHTVGDIFRRVIFDLIHTTSHIFCPPTAHEHTHTITTNVEHISCHVDKNRLNVISMWRRTTSSRDGFIAAADDQTLFHNTYLLVSIFHVYIHHNNNNIVVEKHKGRL